MTEKINEKMSAAVRYLLSLGQHVMDPSIATDLQDMPLDIDTPNALLPQYTWINGEVVRKRKLQNAPILEDEVTKMRKIINDAVDRKEAIRQQNDNPVTGIQGSYDNSNQDQSQFVMSQMAVNYGTTVDHTKLEEVLNQIFTEYRQKIMADPNNNSVNWGTLIQEYNPALTSIRGNAVNSGNLNTAMRDQKEAIWVKLNSLVMTHQMDNLYAAWKRNKGRVMANAGQFGTGKLPDGSDPSDPPGTPPPGTSNTGNQPQPGPVIKPESPPKTPRRKNMKPLNQQEYNLVLEKISKIPTTDKSVFETYVNYLEVYQKFLIRIARFKPVEGDLNWSLITTNDVLIYTDFMTVTTLKTDENIDTSIDKLHHILEKFVQAIEAIEKGQAFPFTPSSPTTTGPITQPDFTQTPGGIDDSSSNQTTNPPQTPVSSGLVEIKKLNGKISLREIQQKGQGKDLGTPKHTGQGNLGMKPASEQKMSTATKTRLMGNSDKSSFALSGLNIRSMKTNNFILSLLAKDPKTGKPTDDTIHSVAIIMYMIFTRDFTTNRLGAASCWIQDLYSASNASFVKNFTNIQSGQDAIDYINSNMSTTKDYSRFFDLPALA